ncbi:hypothetical protein GLOIN_2v592562 [Rhizophagus irregularis DAOM 181602=DAOM 197198]|uniref:Uncharacterized protein n=1 Tax=Rhizophagus irregularis (strain DAOM 181602 / DAOM 197198 / MUCL 43194) TaxID=747089 RepID=A0A2P4QML4_RHIID|nr:hypothetical protein GLOIN_2v592562 [Rhizophagus irregularis DAOM 181602=DAOM 197198]POG78891.1 hypothetical protein GLOIN_2v592562 [Rhizophagus irregularis DAOM 181602=DAOM 197198]|eukprot:XP_025185757.1 hypothetical protein GLOIN_2v592562 [Rhizophagus irregularis DAOM 181602=DAOM 197198]
MTFTCYKPPTLFEKKKETIRQFSLCEYAIHPRGRFFFRIFHHDNNSFYHIHHIHYIHRIHYIHHHMMWRKVQIILEYLEHSRFFYIKRTTSYVFVLCFLSSCLPNKMSVATEGLEEIQIKVLTYIEESLKKLTPEEKQDVVKIDLSAYKLDNVVMSACGSKCRPKHNRQGLLLNNVPSQTFSIIETQIAVEL